MKIITSQCLMYQAPSNGWFSLSLSWETLQNRKIQKWKERKWWRTRKKPRVLFVFTPHYALSWFSLILRECPFYNGLKTLVFSLQRTQYSLGEFFMNFKSHSSICSTGWPSCEDDLDSLSPFLSYHVSSLEWPHSLGEHSSLGKSSLQWQFLLPLLFHKLWKKTQNLKKGLKALFTCLTFYKTLNSN